MSGLEVEVLDTVLYIESGIMPRNAKSEVPVFVDKMSVLQIRNIILGELFKHSLAVILNLNYAYISHSISYKQEMTRTAVTYNIYFMVSYAI